MTLISSHWSNNINKHLCCQLPRCLIVFRHKILTKCRCILVNVSPVPCYIWYHNQHQNDWVLKYPEPLFYLVCYAGEWFFTFFEVMRHFVECVQTEKEAERLLIPIIHIQKIKSPLKFFCDCIVSPSAIVGQTLCNLWIVVLSKENLAHPSEPEPKLCAVWIALEMIYDLVWWLI